MVSKASALPIASTQIVANLSVSVIYLCAGAFDIDACTAAGGGACAGSGGLLAAACGASAVLRPARTCCSATCGDGGAWPRDRRFPFGQLVRNMGEAGDIEAETRALLLENGIEHDEFEQKVLACLEPFRKACLGQTGDKAKAEGAAEGAAVVSPPPPHTAWSAQQLLYWEHKLLH